MTVTTRVVITPDDEAAFTAVRRQDGNPPPEHASDGSERLVAWRGAAPVARCAVSMRDDLAQAPGRSGLIGHYEALDADAGVALLVQAGERLVRRGARRVLAPVNGSTWGPYRLALPAQPNDPGGNPPFFLGEPRNPFEYPSQFVRAGFVVCSNYESRSFRVPETPAATTPELPSGMAQRGITIDELNPARFEDAIREVHQLSLDTFDDNPYYSPIGIREFAASYLPLRPLVDPRLVLFARNAQGLLVSFLFGYPDPMWQPHGRPTRAVVKTIATAREYRGARISRYLLDLFRSRASVLGFSEVIHALMHVANTSMKLSGEQHSQLFRRYALYEWTP